jgi:hypothetical protein
MSRPLRGLLASLANIDPCARLRLSATVIVAAQAGLAAGLRSNDHGSKNAASERRSHRVASVAQRSSREAA